MAKLGRLTILLASVTMVFFFLYTTWTPLDFPAIEGVQGRYFLPIAMFVPTLWLSDPENTPISSWRQSARVISAVLLLLFPIVSFAAELNAIVMAYYM